MTRQTQWRGVSCFTPRILAGLAIILAGRAAMAAESEPWRVLPTGERPQDSRLGALRTLNDTEHPWSPPDSLPTWEQESQRIRRQLLVACGLWPMPPRPPLDPVIHGRVDRDGYTVERVYFRSRPGLYVTGSLYRPKGASGKLPGILSPHGHWQNGRFYDAGEAAAEGELKSGAESFLSAAHFPLQARMVQLARMGCVVFHYDMIGVADQQPLPHREGFNDVEAELWLENKMGLQTWNSIRALDFLCALPDVDTSRIGVTGASGGGTQTFMLCALDDRPAVAFPAVMVSTNMQGGCQCENASYLRIGINNVAIAALMAPRPMKMSGANDWTVEIETRGLPELKQIYTLFGKPELVEAKCHPEFGHNYNKVSREMMYAWFAEHLRLGDVPLEESDFTPLGQSELTVFDRVHPRPDDSLTADRLRELMTQDARGQFEALIPKSAADVPHYREIVGGAATVLLGSRPEAATVKDRMIAQDVSDGVMRIQAAGGAAGHDVPKLALLRPDVFRGEVVLWFDPAGTRVLFQDDGTMQPAVQELLKAGFGVVAADVFQTGEFLAGAERPVMEVDAGFPGYTFGYNRPLLAERVQDILSIVSSANAHPEIRRVHLLGTGAAGPWALLARAIAGDFSGKTVVDLGNFRFSDIKSVDDPNLLPGALRYGDLDGLAALALPGQLTIYGAAGDWKATQAMNAATRGSLRLDQGALKPSAIPAEFLSAP